MSARVKVRLGPGLATSTGARRLDVEATEAVTVREVLEQVAQMEPSLARTVSAAVPFLRGRHAGMDERVADGDEVAIIVPISGG